MDELKIVDYQELLNLISDDENQISDSTLKNYKYLDLTFSSNKEDVFFISLSKNVVTGILQIGSSNVENVLWLKFVTIHPKFRNQGLAKDLLDFSFSYFNNQENIQIDLSSYTPEGEVLIPLIESLAVKFSNLKVRHKLWGGPYQDADQAFYRVGDDVYIEHEDFTGFAKIIKMADYGPIIIESQGENFSVTHESLIFKKN